MTIVVIGGNGRIGSRLVGNLRKQGRRVVSASPGTGVDTTTGRGLADALAGADTVVDVSNVSSLDGDGALRFFEASTRNLLSAGRAAGVRHHVALSVVGLDRLLAGDYFRAKKIQEDLIKASPLPFTLLRSTQFFEFISDVVQAGTEREIAISPARIQPIAAQEIADALTDIVLGVALNATLEIAGPERLHLNDVATEIATAHEDGRQIVVDIHARYFGAQLGEDTLLPGADAFLAPTTFDEWLRQSLQPAWASAPAS
jgi:uncharacterized protein YbjT (DUF2867 family)